MVVQSQERKKYLLALTEILSQTKVNTQTAGLLVSLSKDYLPLLPFIFS